MTVSDAATVAATAVAVAVAGVGAVAEGVRVCYESVVGVVVAVIKPGVCSEQRSVALSIGRHLRVLKKSEKHRSVKKRKRKIEDT